MLVNVPFMLDIYTMLFPISLLGSFYKLVAKVLANRLKRVVGKVV